jgi:hypothetical protein
LHIHNWRDCPQKYFNRNNKRKITVDGESTESYQEKLRQSGLNPEQTPEELSVEQVDRFEVDAVAPIPERPPDMLLLVIVARIVSVALVPVRP